jgi:hypothetical protein
MAAGIEARLSASEDITNRVLNYIVARGAPERPFATRRTFVSAIEGKAAAPAE